MDTATRPSAHGRLQGVTVLILEDHKDTREMYAANLRGQGAAVHEAGTAQTAMLLLQEKRPDVMLVDLELPDVDGWHFVKAVRQLDPEEGGKTPAIALTVHNTPEARGRTLTSGFQLHLQKPMDPEELTRIIAGLLTATS